MNLNSQYLYYPPQPDNPTDHDRDFLLQYSLNNIGRPEDFSYIKKYLNPLPSVTNYANPGEFKNLKVGIIGGGLAGLTAAFELRKLGFDIKIFDALTDRVGGRIYTYYFNDDKTSYGEFGAMRIPVSHQTVWHYINLFNIPTRPFIQSNPNAIIYLKNIRVRNDRDGLNVKKYIYPKYNLTASEKEKSWKELLAIGENGPLLNATPEERSEIIRVLPDYCEKTLEFNTHTVLQIFERQGLSQEAINLVSNFGTVLSANLYNSYIDYIQDTYTTASSFVYEIPGGMQKLPMAFYQSFSGNNISRVYPDIKPQELGRVKFIAGVTVNGIYYDNTNNKVALQYFNHFEHNNERESFDYVVCAIPFSALRNVIIEPLFSNIKLRAIKEVNYSTAQKTLLQCKERFWERQGIYGGGSVTDLPIVSIWYPSDHAKYLSKPESGDIDYNKIPSDEVGVILGSYNDNLDATRLTNLPMEARDAYTKYYLERVHGIRRGLLDRIVTDIKTLNWDHQPTFRGSLCFFAPDQKRIFSYGMTLPEYNEKIFFAGEHISAVHRWMQGAMQSGMKAANDLAQACRKHKTRDGSVS